MDYTTWRITYQSAEQAARAAYQAAQQSLAQCKALEAELATQGRALEQATGALIEVNDYCQRHKIGKIGDSACAALIQHCDKLQRELGEAGRQLATMRGA